MLINNSIPKISSLPRITYTRIARTASTISLLLASVRLVLLGRIRRVGGRRGLLLILIRSVCCRLWLTLSALSGISLLLPVLSSLALFTGQALRQVGLIFPRPIKPPINQHSR